MREIEEIKLAISNLSPHEFSVFREWFAKFDATAWDRQFENDVHAGQFNELAAEAIKDLKQGRCRDL
ncbi:MAG: hypothetical protein QM796_18925 [Chthoniobacteraceae bacterium]